MNPPDLLALRIVGAGHASAERSTDVSRNAPSFYADPAAWLVTAAVADALTGCGTEVRAAADEVGIIVLSARGTSSTMDAISRTASTGLVSPLRFAGANPGLLAGLPCITWRLRGPSLTLAMRPAAGLDTAIVVATSWLLRRQARYVLLATEGDDRGLSTARCVVTAPATGEPADPTRLRTLLLPAADPSRSPAP